MGGLPIWCMMQCVHLARKQSIYSLKLLNFRHKRIHYSVYFALIYYFLLLRDPKRALASETRKILIVDFE